MAASGSAVSVLTPNGRRQTVKVSPNTPLLQVLEDVCKKHNFNPDEYGLKFQRNVLDLTLQWRFASLPNNAKLEIVPSSRNQTGTESQVRIALQLEDGSRLQDNFSNAKTLWDLLTRFPQTRTMEREASGPTPVCVYMRDEISGEAALKKTTLKSLGLTGGSAIIRYVLKATPESGEQPDAVAKTTDAAAKTTAVISTPIDAVAKATEPQPPPSVPPTLPDQPAAATPVSVSVVTPAPSADEVIAPLNQTLEEEQSVRPKTKPTSNQQHIDEERPGTSQQQSSARSVAASNFVPFSGGGNRLGGPGSSVPKTSASWTSSVSASPPKAKKPKPNHDVKALDRESMVFHLDSGGVRHRDDGDLPDEFFEVTMDDVRKRFAQLKSERRALEEAPLMTKSLRESRMNEKLDRYPKVVLRIQFPDRHVLQGFFRPLETVGDLRDFIKSHLQDPQMQFYLFVAPPKTILDDPGVTLFQASLFPAAVVYFGSDVRTDCYLHTDLLDRSVSALQADEVITGCMPRSPPPPLSSSEDVHEDDLLKVESSASSSQQRETEDTADSQNSAPKPVKTDPSKVPKWLKLPGKK